MMYTIGTYRYNRYNLKKDFFKSYSFYYILLVVISMLVWGIDDLTFITYLIVPIFSYNFFKLTDYENFKKKWLIVTTFISSWSLLAYLFFLYGFPTNTVLLGTTYKCELLLGINLRVAESRLCGLSFEPGVYQIFLLFTLLMWIKDIRNRSLSSKEKLCLLSCLFALLATQSTMGYLGLIMVLGAFVTSKDYLRRHFKKAIGLTVLLVPLAFVLFTSSVVQDKFNEADGNESYSIRLLDTMASYSMIETSPFLGNGIGERWANLAAKYGNITNSNGVLNMISRLGVFWIVFYVLFLIKFSKNNHIGIWPLYFTLIILIVFMNEDIVYSPLGFIFVSNFKGI